MSESKKQIEIAGIVGPIWAICAMFTMGFLKLSFFKGFLAIAFWPYYLGEYFAK